MVDELTGFTIRITGLLIFPGHKCEKLSDFQDKGQFLLLPGHFQDPNGIPGHFQDFQDGWPPCYIIFNKNKIICALNIEDDSVVASCAAKIIAAALQKKRKN